jgi:hypothetical protein
MFRSSFLVPLALVLIGVGGYAAWRYGWAARAADMVCTHVTALYCGRLAMPGS